MPENRGKAAAVMEGFSRIGVSSGSNYGSNSNSSSGFGSDSGSSSGSSSPSPSASEFACDAVILLDADGQHEPEQIPLLLQPILEDKADLVIGSRFLTTDNSIPAYRKVGQKTLNFATNLSTPNNGSNPSNKDQDRNQDPSNISGNQGETQGEVRTGSSNGNGRFKSTDSQSGFRALGPRALANLDFSSEDYNLESDMIFHMAGRGLRIAEVPISVRYEDVPNKHKKNPVSHGYDVLAGIVGAIGYKRPLIFFGVPGGILGLCGLFLCMYVLSELVKYNIFHYMLAILGVGSFALGLLLITSGLILNSLVLIMKRK